MHKLINKLLWEKYIVSKYLSLNLNTQKRGLLKVEFLGLNLKIYYLIRIVFYL